MRQRRFARLTWLRAERLTHGFTLAETALKAGIPHFRASETERDPENAKPEDVTALRRATAELAAEREAGKKP